MTLQQLQYFLAAVEHGSFSAAADALHMAQPSLSEQVRRLESELGVDLFTRVGRGLVLTEAGQNLRPHAEEVVAAAEDARESVAEVRAIRGGTVSLGMFGDAPYYLLTEVIEEFRIRHPDVRVRIVGQNSSEVADDLRAGELEAAVIALPVDDTGLDVRPIMDVEIFFTTAEPDRLPKRMTVERLARVPLIVYDAHYGWEDPTRRQLWERAQRAGVSLDPVVEIEDVMAAVRLAARGVGDTVVSQAVATGSRFPRNLRLAPFDPPLRDTFAVVTRRGGRLSPASRELLELAEEQMTTFADRVAARGGEGRRRVKARA
jgi:DNA-binding transcriptional LysR family regulator